MSPTLSKMLVWTGLMLLLSAIMLLGDITRISPQAVTVGTAILLCCARVCELGLHVTKE